MPDAAPKLPTTLPTRPKPSPRFLLVAVVNLSKSTYLACARSHRRFSTAASTRQGRRLLLVSAPMVFLVDHHVVPVHLFGGVTDTYPELSGLLASFDRPREYRFSGGCY